MTQALYRVVFSSTVARDSHPIATAATPLADALTAFNFQSRAPRFSAWTGTERMRVVTDDQWRGIKAAADRRERGAWSTGRPE